MMDINDVKKLIDNVAQKPFLCSNTEITTDNGYVITTKEHYEKLRKHRLCQARGREAIFHRWTELATVNCCKFCPSVKYSFSSSRLTQTVFSQFLIMLFCGNHIAVVCRNLCITA